MNEKDFSLEFWEFVHSKQTKKAARVYNWLNHDNLGGIYSDGMVWRFELVASFQSTTKDARDMMRQFAKQKGLGVYLFDL